ncbi:MAG: hypothetical protein B6I29_00625 [Marinitoga sp. 4572_148]|nr:MAG: hypothetical protein B6I29_00625 [Marinitoga sp. 4572_148]
MKNKIFLVVVIILSLSNLFAFGSNNINQNVINNAPAQISLSLNIEELDNYTFSALAVDDEGTYYILRLSPLLMYYGNLPINVKDTIVVDGIVLSNFSKIKEIMVNTANINNQTYSIINNNGYMNNQIGNYNRGMMNGYGMRGGYGYPGMMNGWYDHYYDPYDYEMMNGYPGNINNYNQNIPNNMNGRK